MGFYARTAFRLFSKLSESISYYFTETKTDLKTARFKISLQEYLSTALLSCLIFFLVGLPVLSCIFVFIFEKFVFSFAAAFGLSILLAALLFYVFLTYPKIIIKEKAKKLDKNLPFASLYLSTVSGSKLPLHEVFKIFSKFSGYKAITEEVNLINQDMEMFGFDINTAIERAIERSPSKNFKELLWGILSTIMAGGDLALYLKEKSKTFISEYRRTLYEYSHTLSLYIEVYLTVIILGTIFFTILTAIISAIGGAATNIIFLQFVMIFLLVPAVSVLFIILIRSTTPGGE